MNLWTLPPMVVAGTVVAGTGCQVHPAAGTAGNHLAAVEDLADVEELAAVEDLADVEKLAAVEELADVEEPTDVEDQTAVEHPTAVVVPSLVAPSEWEAGHARIPGVE